MFRTLRLLRHAIPVAATYDHKGLPVFGPLGRSTYRGYYCRSLYRFRNNLRCACRSFCVASTSFCENQSHHGASPCRFSHGRPPAAVYGSSRYFQLLPRIE
ncbi:hypothetical protein ACQKWADRAFT_298764 [Trichoderma austrokoningii]